VKDAVLRHLFDVRSTRDPINIAYGSGAIVPHQDLAYYESPPGIQLLHCLEFDAAIDGGDSLLIDGFVAAEALREEDPAAFATLARVPATFLEDQSATRPSNPCRRARGPRHSVLTRSPCPQRQPAGARAAQLPAAAPGARCRGPRDRALLVAAL
jgi:alpha-ketoglutarate-dependent taurine dioxygenase